MKGVDIMSKASLEAEIRQKYYDLIYNYLESIGEQPMATGAGAFDVPAVDSNGEECFATIKVTIPRGRRVDGSYEPYDGYEAHEEWKMELADRADKKRASSEKKARAEAERQRKKEAKKVVKTMKKDMQEIFGENQFASTEE